MRYYIALLHKDPKSDYGVSFPDLPGCITAGRTLDEARAMAVDALALHLQGMIEDGDAIPEPSSRLWRREVSRRCRCVQVDCARLAVWPECLSRIPAGREGSRA